MAGEGSDAAGKVALVWDGHLDYDFGPRHPMRPARVELTVELIHALGLFDGDERVEVSSGPYDEDQLLRVHRENYVETVKRAGANPSDSSAWKHGLGPGDNPVFQGMHQASMQVCAASTQAARLVWEGEVDHAFNPAGGLHHAMPDRASGFCIYNDPAVAIDWLLDHGAERIAYLDVDVHHGDGVESIFWDDPRVLTISLHESGRFLFPGTGFAEDCGGEGAEGYAANLPLYPDTTGDVWLSAYDAVAEPLIRSFRPQVLVTQLGCDTHSRDPLAHLHLTTADYATIARRVHRLAHEAAGGRWVATGGGGYQLLQVVPRAWAIWFAEMCGADLPEETPQSWREAASGRDLGSPPRAFLDEPVEVVEDTHERTAAFAEESIAAVREHVLRRHDLD